jgi:hypothetical protein
MRNVTLNGVSVRLSSHNQLSDIGLVYRAHEYMRFNGNRIEYEGISKDDLSQLSCIASEGISGYLDGIKSIANLMMFVNWEDAGTDDLNGVACVIAGMCDIGQNMNGHAQTLDAALRGDAV